ncbi:hypothetical protein DTB58_39370 [Streptomyces griseus]|nr:hypothetical protein [Streptomyces griseus]
MSRRSGRGPRRRQGGRCRAAPCRQGVLGVLAAMRRNRQALSDAEFTRRAGVNPQYLQRHRDLGLLFIALAIVLSRS